MRRLLPVKDDVDQHHPTGNILNAVS